MELRMLILYYIHSVRISSYNKEMKVLHFSSNTDSHRMEIKPL